MDAAKDAAQTSPEEQGDRSGFEKFLAMAQDRVEDIEAARQKLQEEFEEQRSAAELVHAMAEQPAHSPESP